MTFVKQTQAEFIRKSKAIFGNKYNYSKVSYKNSVTEVILICEAHGDFPVIPGPHLSYKRGCKVCSGVTWNLQTFIEKAKAIHGEKYTYDKVIYKMCKLPVIITCKIHGDFSQTPDKHAREGQGCPRCYKQRPKDLDYFLSEAKIIHGDTYDYSKVELKLMLEKVEIICSKHGSFWQPPTAHINKVQNGCPRCHCESTRETRANFLERSQAKHGDRFDYSKAIYTNAITNVEIICKKHGSFWRRPHKHMNGAGCRKCVGGISKKELAWLDFMGIPNDYRDKVIRNGKKFYRVDALDPKTNTIYEFYGDYWHGNPNVYNVNYINKHNKQKFSDLYKKTIKREKRLKLLGYKIITIWESDWMKILRDQKKKNGYRR